MHTHTSSVGRFRQLVAQAAAVIVLVGSGVCMGVQTAAAKPIKEAFGMVLGGQVKEDLLTTKRKKSKYIKGAYYYDFRPIHPHKYFRVYTVWVTPVSGTIIAIRAGTYGGWTRKRPMAWDRLSIVPSVAANNIITDLWLRKYKNKFYRVLEQLADLYRQEAKDLDYVSFHPTAYVRFVDPERHTKNYTELSSECEFVGDVYYDDVIKMDCKMELEYTLGGWESLLKKEVGPDPETKGL